MRKKIRRIVASCAIVFLASTSIVQSQTSKNEFWDKVQYGGGFGIGFSTNGTNFSLAPSAIYNVNKFVALGTSVQYNYSNFKNYYTSQMYGGSVIALVNPLDFIQLSTELEQLRVNVSYENSSSNAARFWNTALFLGAGYRTNNLTIGVRYNVLHKDKNNVYNDAFMPFIRIYF
jgi:hypothetical protein